MGIPTAAEIEAIRKRDEDAGLNSDVQSDRDRRTLLLALDIETTEASIRKRRVEIGCEIASDLRSQLDAVTSERDRLSALIARDCITPCACCGVKLSWEWLGDGTNAIEVKTGKSHECQHSMDTSPKGTYRYAERENARLQAENKVLRTCFCIADDETVVSSVEGSILIDNKGGTRRRYFVATDEEQKLKEKLNAVAAERDRLQTASGIHCDGLNHVGKR